MPADARELLIQNLALIERVIAFTCRRNKLSESDAEEFASVVKLKLVENDYQILTRFEGRSKFSTFMAIVVQRMLLDFRIQAWGKWHDSAEATRLGDVAVELERLLHRDERPFDEAATIAMARHPGTTRPSLRVIADRLPTRPPRRRMVALEEALHLASPGDDVEQRALESDRRGTAIRIFDALRELIEGLPQEDSLILKLRFESGMTVAQVARALHLDQRLLYRRIDQRLRELRTQLEEAGFRSSDVADLVGRENGLALNLENSSPRPSIESEGAAAVPQEENAR